VLSIRDLFKPDVEVGTMSEQDARLLLRDGDAPPANGTIRRLTGEQLITAMMPRTKGAGGGVGHRWKADIRFDDAKYEAAWFADFREQFRHALEDARIAGRLQALNFDMED
jgi:hypothetical protein